MNSSLISWISQPPGTANSMHNMDLLDEEDFSALFRQDVHNFLPLGNSRISSSSSSSTAFINNIPSFSSLHTSPFMEQPKLPALGLPDTININLINHHHQASSGLGRPMNSMANWPPALNLEEEAVMVVPEILSSQQVGLCGATKSEETPKSTKKRSRFRAPSQTHDHIIAERRRREQLSQLFVSLSALVPGLKKMDKGSVLEDAIKYMKRLQERVQKLEEMAKTHAMESIVVVKKSQIMVADDETTWEDEHCSSSVDEQPLPEVEAKVCDSHILVRVNCEKHKGLLATLICKVESLNMIVVNTNAIQLGNVAMDITIIAELEKGFNMTAKEVVTVLREALRPAAAA